MEAMWTALVIVVASVVVTIAACLLFGRSHAHEQADDRDADSRGFLGAVISGLFIVALAFYMVIVWEDNGAAEDNAAREAASVADAYWQTAVMPQPQRDHIRSLLREYPKLVADKEWPQLAHGSADDRTTETLNSLHAEVLSLPSTPDQVKSARERVLERVREITDLRRDRVDQAGGLDNTGKFMLIGTLVGAVGMIAFPLLIGFTARARHVVQMGVTAAVLAFVCVLCLGMTHPFSGVLRVQPEAFTSVTEELAGIPAEHDR
jgi:formate hydrogenlyase subunit 3/multisubunit Na+/H+ antiporter MnhD subunit